MLKIVPNDADRDNLTSSLDELVAEGARRMLIAGLEAEVADYIERHQELVDEAGHRLVVRNGKAEERNLVTGAGALKVRAPRVNDRRDGHVYSSYIPPKHAR
jgi:putative transposase